MGQIIRAGYATHRRSGSTRSYRKARAEALLNAMSCSICGEGPRADDPWEAHHEMAFADYGHLGPLVPAHQSCNRRVGRGRGVPRRP